ncbi:MAG: hypothetical protein P8Y97_07885 [Candidatus Lokiarchaeota archaeon]
MSVKTLLDNLFKLEGNIEMNKIFYDSQDVNLNDDSRNLRSKFDIFKEDPYSKGRRIKDKIVDGAGHYNDCPYYLIEVTTSDILKALSQIESTIRHIYKNGEKVRKVAIILDEKRWKDTLARSYYKIKDDLLFIKGKNNNYKLTFSYDGSAYEFDIFCYLKNFQKYDILRA